MLCFYYRYLTINEYLKKSFLPKPSVSNFKMKSNITISNRTEKLANLSRETYTKRLAELSKGISHPVRVEIVRMLSQKPKDARFVCGDIVDSFPLAQSSVSQHLKVLKDTGWIQGEIDGPCVCYCIVEDIVEYYTALIERCLSI